MNGLFLKYVDARPADKKQMVELVGRNSPVGGLYGVMLGKANECSYIVNEYKNAVSKVEDEMRSLQVATNRGFEVGASLAWVAYDSRKNEYFAKFVVFAYDSSVAAFSEYVKRFCARLAGGVRPSAEIGDYEIAQIKQSGGKWKTQNIKLSADLPKGCALTKSKQELMDKIIDGAKKRKPGCWVGTALFFALVGVLIWWIVSLF